MRANDSRAAMDATLAQNVKNLRIRKESDVPPNRARETRNGLVATITASNQRRLMKFITRD
jgi:hypothetical protein